MFLPVNEKSWNHTFTAGPLIGQPSINIMIESGGSADEHRRKILLALKNMLVGLGWTVKCSSNGSSYGPTDKWLTTSDLRYAGSGTAHSWIVLTNPGWGYDLLLDCDNWSTYYLTFKIAPNGDFSASGGSITASPTAPAYTWTFFSQSQWLSNTGYEWSSIIHGMQSTDNKTTRIAIYSGGGRQAVWMFEHILDTVVPWTLPVAVIWPTQGTRVENLIRVGNQWGMWYMTRPDPATWPTQAWLSANMTVEAVGGGLWSISPLGMMTYYTGFDGELGGWPFSQLGLCGHHGSGGVADSAIRGKIGRLADVWLGANGNAEGDCYLNESGGQVYAHWGALIVPWDGASPCQVC